MGGGYLGPAPGWPPSGRNPGCMPGCHLGQQQCCLLNHSTTSKEICSDDLKLNKILGKGVLLLYMRYSATLNLKHTDLSLRGKGALRMRDPRGNDGSKKAHTKNVKFSRN